MELKENIILNADVIDKYSVNFLENSELNPFYDKNIFFTQGLRASKYIEFQILGNLGGRANDYSFDIKTDFYIVADKLINDLYNGIKDAQLQQLEIELNKKERNMKS
ncbi:hypothetical protein ACFCT7_03555 [Fulvivirgaceae bacterium LMO-SS25]